jgi:hypothetical protein
VRQSGLMPMLPLLLSALSVAMPASLPLDKSSLARLCAARR